MAEFTNDIPELRSRLKARRDRLAWGVEALRFAANVPQRLQRDMTMHPLKWAGIALIGGAVIVRLVPGALAILRLAASGKVVRAILSGVAPIVARAGLDALAASVPPLDTDVRRGLPP